MSKKLFILMSLMCIFTFSAKADWVWWSGFPQHTKSASPGFRFGLFSGGYGWVHNWEAGIFSASTRKAGIQSALILTNSEESAIQLSMLWNNSNQARCQISACNVGISISGVQLGLINIAEEKSIQIGVINIITNKKRAWRILPIFNIR